MTSTDRSHGGRSGGGRTGRLNPDQMIFAIDEFPPILISIFLAYQVRRYFASVLTRKPVKCLFKLYFDTSASYTYGSNNVCCGAFIFRDELH